MKQYWLRFAASIDTRNQRERMLIFIAAIVVFLALANALAFEPLQAKRKLLSQQATQQRDQLAEIAANIRAAQQAGKVDPDAPLRVRMAAVKQRLAESEVALRSTQESLVAPDKMAHLLEDVLSQNRNLKLVALKTLPVSGVLEKPDDKQDKTKAATPPAVEDDKPKAATGPAIYKHGVEITVAGAYADLTQYLDGLEKLPWQMYWGKAEMRVDEYPRVVLTITLYTLSMDKTWLSV